VSGAASSLSPEPEEPAKDRSFPHEKLTCYELATSLSRWFRSQRFPPGCADLADHGRRASTSMALNIAEGCYLSGGNRRKHFGYAMASAAEACAVLDQVELLEGAERQAELRRVGAMVAGSR